MNIEPENDSEFDEHAVQPVDIPGGLFPQHPYDFATWNKFATEFSGHPALRHETIYSLPSELVAAIRQHAAGVLNREDEHFELQLGRIAGRGFFMRRPIECSLIERWGATDSTDDPREKELQERQQATDRRIQEMYCDEFRRSGYSEAEIDQHFEDERVVKQKIDDKRIGYAGWLIANLEFRNAVAELRRKWETKITQYGGYPRVGISLFGEKVSPPSPHRSRFYLDWILFYQRWGLERMATNELPILYNLDSISRPFMNPVTSVACD